MKTAAVTVAAFLAATNAQYYNITSKPFQLLLTSANGSIDNVVSACHVGAGIESLCLLNDTSGPATASDTFHFNTSIYSQPPVNHTELGTPGILTWFLPTGNTGLVPSSVQFGYDPTTNYATPLLFPGDDDAQQLAFDDSDELLVQGYINHSTNPPTYIEAYGLKRWYACTTNYAGYIYDNLIWGLGAEKPENPSCVAVTVKRAFV